MGLIQDFLKKRKDRVGERKDYERSSRIPEQIEAKKLSSNERELMIWKEKERQNRIKVELEKFKKKENDEIWSGQKGNPISSPNVTNNHKQLFNHDNMFAHQKNMFNERRNLFFNR